MKNIIAPAYKNWDEEIFKSYINKFNLKLNQKIETLSKGMRMKYSIALALSHKAEFLIMDEPTSGLDPLIRTELMNILLEFMKNGGKGVFFSTHITSDLEKVADKLILINKGQIIFNERKETLINSYRIVKGKKGLLSNEMKHSFITFNDYGDDFEGITVDKSIFNKQIDALTLIQPTIEDIMLAYIEGRSCECLTF
jgi:ABC-2 type transport system ATP-binding protein